jgi:hypothetical protein
MTREAAPRCASRTVPHHRLPVRCAVRPCQGMRARVRETAGRTPARSRHRAFGRLNHTSRRARRSETCTLGPHLVDPAATGRTRQVCELGATAARAWTGAAHPGAFPWVRLWAAGTGVAPPNVCACADAPSAVRRGEKGESRSRKSTGRGFYPSSTCDALGF